MRRGPSRFDACRLFVLLSLCALVTAFFPAGSAAQIDTHLNEIRQKQTENTDEIAAAENELTALRDQYQQLQATANALAGQLDTANQRLAAAQAAAAQYDLAAIELAAKIEVTQRKLDEAIAATRRSAVLLYQRRSDSTAMLDLIGNAEGSGQFVEAKHYLEHVSDKRHQDADRVGQIRADLAKQQTQLDDARKQADNARDQAAAEQHRVGGLYDQQQQAIAAVTASEGSYNSKLDALKGQKAQLAADLQAESDKIAAQLAQQRDFAPLGNGSFIRPIPGAPIVSPFGYRTDPFTGAQTFHSGVDFGASCGTPILAAGTGLVVSAGDDGGYGNATLLNHGGGLATLYAHQSAFAVSAGQVVVQGQVIGYVGTTGISTGCHLHFEVRVNGTPVNPLNYL